ncbi:MAG: cellulose binding domain-containing protein, partial [Ruminiclostridium sp.]|nr:cellulose binding domain-containing protein [Ruminiclostridium sp.]
MEDSNIKEELDENAELSENDNSEDTASEKAEQNTSDISDNDTSVNDDKTSVLPVTDEETTEKQNKTANLTKWLLITVIAMAVVIISLTGVLIAVLAGKSADSGNQDSSYSMAENSVASGEQSSDSQSKTDSSYTDSTISSVTESVNSSQPTSTEEGIILQYSVDNSWGDEGNMNYGVQLGITNNTGSTISGWELVVEIDGLISCDGWNGTYTQNGNTLTISNAEYNGDIQTGGTVVVGCNINTSGDLKINKATLNNTDCVVKVGTVNQNNQGNNPSGSSQSGENQGEPVDVDALLERSENAEQGDDW